MVARSGILKVVLDGKGPATLRPVDHVATGGEGSVYRSGDLAIKIYLDAEKMRRLGLPEKIKLLAAELQHPSIAAPLGVVLDDTHDPVGHYLKFVEGHHLSLVFTNDFWTKQSFDQAGASKLVDGMRAVVEFAHQKSAVLVDANELNWLTIIDPRVEPRVIDVDSWAIARWPASVVMPSIRDWNNKSFDQGTDWFSWGVVTFQIYVGLHPYKGTLSGFDRGDMVGRMRSRASVFTPGVKFNRAVRDFGTIPPVLREWYQAVFQGTERCRPPSPYDRAVSAAPAAKTSRTIVVGGEIVRTEKLFSGVGNPAKKVFHCGVVLTKSGDLFDLESLRKIGRGSKDCEVVRTKKGWLVAEVDSLAHVAENTLGSEVLDLVLERRRLLRHQDRLFAVADRGLVEIKLQFFGTKAVASAGETWGTIINSTSWFDGMGVLDAIGATFLVVPLGIDAVVQHRAEVLDGLKVVSAKAGARFATLVALDRAGDYHKFELTFLDNVIEPPRLWRGKTDNAELNVAILPKGVCATIVKDGELDIFVPPSGAMRRVEDPQVSTEMLLSNWKDLVVFIRDGDVWSIKLR